MADLGGFEHVLAGELVKNEEGIVEGIDVKGDLDTLIHANKNLDGKNL